MFVLGRLVGMSKESGLKRENMQLAVGWRYLVDSRGQRGMTRLLLADRKAALLLIYNHLLQERYAEHHSHQLRTATAKCRLELMLHLDARIRIWHKQHKSMAPS